MRGAMAIQGRGVVVSALAVVALAALVSAQITFSRDWTGGKRSAAPQLALDCSQFARLCRHFIHEMKTAMSTDLSNTAASKRRRPIEDVPSVYEDE